MLIIIIINHITEILRNNFEYNNLTKKVYIQNKYDINLKFKYKY